MTKITVVSGNLIEMFSRGEFDAIGHGCNCVHAMKSGIAYKLDEFTGGKLSAVDRKTSYANINKMGSWSSLETEHGVIYNMYTQFKPAVTKQEVVVHWKSVHNAIIAAIRDVIAKKKLSKIRLGIPLIGCGLANGREEDLVSVLDDVATNYLFEAEIIEIVVVKLL